MVTLDSTVAIGRGQATAQGRNVGAVSGIVASITRGQATAQGRAVALVIDSTAVPLRGQATATGRATLTAWSSTAALTRGQATAQGRNVTATQTLPVGWLEAGLFALSQESIGQLSGLIEHAGSVSYVE
jgi:hypothetical protein